MKSIHKNIIIGGGIAGISAAQQLRAHGVEFQMLTENIGGRIHTSKHGNVQYGAYYVMQSYAYSRPFVRRGRRIKPTSLVFHKGSRGYSLLQPSFIRDVPQTLRLIRILRMFKKQYVQFKRDCCYRSQAEVIRSNPYLRYLYHTKATTFIEKNSIDRVVREYIEEVLHGTTFTSVETLNAFTFLQFSLPLITPIYQFTLDTKRALQGLEDMITQDTVTRIEPEKNDYVITTAKNTYRARNVIVATPPQVSQKLLGIPHIKGAVNAHMFHIIGQVRERWHKGDYNLFSDKNDMLAIAFMPDHSCLFYSKKEKPDFHKYFYEYSIVEHKHWGPAFHIEGSVLWESVRGTGLYLIGDHNVCGIEDACISGIYAAHQIIASS